MKKIEIFCVTNISSKKLETLKLSLAGVGKKKFSSQYISCAKGINIQKKEKNYSELTFHYWFWKNKLKDCDNKTWIGFCQKRRFWLKKKVNNNTYIKLKKNILKKVPAKWKNFDSVLCEPISVSGHKKMKLIKRGWRNVFKNPNVFFNKDKQNIKLHFDMHHGYGVLDKAINVLNKKDRDEFRDYVNTSLGFNPHIMFIAKKKIAEKWFKSLFEWLFKCEKVFGTKKLIGYDQERLYAYLAERYLPFWFKKYANPTDWPWTFFDLKK